MQPKLIIHGGIGTERSFQRKADDARRSLERIANQSYQFLQGHSALEAAVHAVSLLEDDPIFNAGTGSKIQSDGIIRMTAAVMDGTKRRFAGVINITDVKNPVQVAALLLPLDDRVLSGSNARDFARKHGFDSHNPETPERRIAFEEKRMGISGTVGCVALDINGNIAAATSTGGKGMEMPGRVSDSATVAGTFANQFAAVSCTGTGEDIVDEGLAVKIVMRTTNGLELQQACSRSIEEMRERGGHAGVIALNSGGEVFCCGTEPYLTYAIHDGSVTLF